MPILPGADACGDWSGGSGGAGNRSLSFEVSAQGGKRRFASRERKTGALPTTPSTNAEFAKHKRVFHGTACQNGIRNWEDWVRGDGTMRKSRSETSISLWQESQAVPAAGCPASRIGELHNDRTHPVRRKSAHIDEKVAVSASHQMKSVLADNRYHFDHEEHQIPGFRKQLHPECSPSSSAADGYPCANSEVCIQHEAAAIKHSPRSEASGGTPVSTQRMRQRSVPARMETATSPSSVSCISASNGKSMRGGRNRTPRSMASSDSMSATPRSMSRTSSYHHRLPKSARTPRSTAESSQASRSTSPSSASGPDLHCTSSKMVKHQKSAESLASASTSGSRSSPGDSDASAAHLQALKDKVNQRVRMYRANRESSSPSAASRCSSYQSWRL